MKPSHCECGYEFAQDMRYCPYCGKKRGDNKPHTCQICARHIKDTKGLIAHHGYRRPGTGEQTTSCPGARQLPYEKSNAAIPAYILRLEGLKETHLILRQKILNDQIPISNGHSITSPHYRVLEQNDPFYTTYKKYRVQMKDREINSIQREITRLQERHDKWKVQE